MKTMRIALAAAAVIGAAVPAVSAGEDLQKILVPIYVRQPLPGNFGSLWTTELWLSNAGPEFANTGGYEWDCSTPNCYDAPPVAPGATFRPRAFPAPAGFQGSFLFLDVTTAAQVRLALRFRDLSRQDSTWGTEVPAPRDTDFQSGVTHLIDVPLTEGFRQTLRIYELDPTPRNARVRVRLYALDATATEPGEVLGDSKVADFEVALRFVPGTASHPGYAEVSDLPARLISQGVDRVRIEVEPATAGLKLWAFATIIHNETQHATVVTP